MRSLSKDEARQIGAELKRWSQRSVSASNVRALGLSSALAVLVIVGAQHLPAPAAAVRNLASMYAMMLASMHFIWMGVLRGLSHAGVAEAQDAIGVMRDPRRISAFDMAMMWLLIAAVARRWE